MRINTDGDYAWRAETYEETAQRLGQGTKSAGIDAACDFAAQMEQRLERALAHPDMTPELADLLSTSYFELDVHEVREFKTRADE